jgi:hypothetical protein
MRFRRTMEDNPSKAYAFRCAAQRHKRMRLQPLRQFEVEKQIPRGGARADMSATRQGNRFNFQKANDAT